MRLQEYKKSTLAKHILAKHEERLTELERKTYLFATTDRKRTLHA